MPPPHSGKTKMKMTSNKALIKNSSLPDKAAASETIKPHFFFIHLMFDRRIKETGASVFKKV